MKITNKKSNASKKDRENRSIMRQIKWILITAIFLLIAYTLVYNFTPSMLVFCGLVVPLSDVLLFISIGIITIIVVQFQKKR